MNILHIIQRLSHGGIESFVLTLVRSDRARHFIFIIEGTRDSAFQSLPPLIDIENNLIFANKKEGFQFQVSTLIKKACLDHHISIIHTHHIGPLIYATLTTLLFKKIAHIHTEHDIWHLKQRKDFLIQALLFKLKKIHLVAVSHYIYDGLNTYFPHMDITLIYNAVDTNLFKPGNKQIARSVLNLPENKIIIGSSGRLEEIKGHRFLIQAMTELPDIFYLAIAGNGQLRHALQKQIDELGLNSQVVLLGYIENTDLFYQACDLFCLPSLDEGLPLALLEAQACNLPAICCDVGGCSEAMVPGIGLLVKPGSPKALADACLSLQQENRTTRDYIVDHFSLPILIKKYQQLYIKALT